MFVHSVRELLFSPIRICCLLAVVISSTCSATAKVEKPNSGPLPTILSRYRSLVLNRRAPDAVTVQEYQSTLQAGGDWPDIDYKSKARASWPPGGHLRRVVVMALAYAQAGHRFQGDKALLKTIHRALDHWLANHYASANWWHNVIATPRSLGTIGVLINDELTGARRKGLLKAMRKCPIGRTGANLMDQAQIVMVRACLANNTALLKKAVKAIAGEIKVSNGEGIQEDWSYHQHGACSQPLSYGRVYLTVLRDVGWVVRGTPYELPREKRAIISMFLLNGVQWMTRGTYTAPSTIDRQVSRPNALAGASADFRSHLQKWIEVDPDNAPALKAFLARQNGDLTPLSGFRHFYRSDLSVYHRPGFSLFLKTRSERVKGTEGTNDENLKGRPYLHTGDHYIVRDGSEYTALPPVWDWSRLPGLTMFEGIEGITPQVFVGGLGSGDMGFTAMDYSRGLSVRKFWAFHGDLAICLLGGWQGATAKKGLRTTLDQCALDGPVQVNTEGKTKTLNKGVHQLPKVRWVLHKGIGYVPLLPSTVSLRMEEAKGSWRQVNASRSDTVIKEQVFTCDLVNGEFPVANGFILAPGSTAETLEQLTQSPPYEVIHNNRNLQCIRFKDGTFMAAFYEPGEVVLNKEHLISVNKPCLALWSGRDLYLCDPTNPKAGVPAKVLWHGKTMFITLPAGGKAFHISHADLASGEQ